jgi:hypothetical protein
MDSKQLSQALQACLDQGFEPPLVACAVSLNGCVLAVRYAYHPLGEGMQATVLAEHTPDPAFLLPINMMITDARGEAARVVIQYEGWTFTDLN